MSFLKRIYRKLFRKKPYSVNMALINIIRKEIPKLNAGELVGMQALPMNPEAKFKLKKRAPSKYGGYNNRRFVRWRMRRTFINQIEKAHLKSGWDVHLGCHMNKITGDLVCVYEVGHSFMSGYYVNFAGWPHCVRHDMELGKFLEKFKRTDNQPKSLEEFAWWVYS